MSEREKKLIRAARTARLAFKEDESRQAWLPLLLEANAIVDAGVSEAIHRDEKQGRMLACHKGCAACCRSHTTIPVYPLELIGITWYAVEKITGPVREQLKQQLRDHKKGEPCPLPMKPSTCCCRSMASKTAANANA